MVLDSDRPRDPPDPSPCKRCKGTFKFLTSLPRTGDQPAYWIFECTGCNHVEWVMNDAD